jgi:phage tail-like protein
MTTSTIADGWLADQLPRPLSEDHFTRQFLRIFEDMASSVRARVVSFEHDLDAGVAPVEFVRWMGQWLAVPVQPFLPEERQRALVAAAGALWKRRGTAQGLRGLLEALTGAEVEIDDGGGVFGEGEAPPNLKKVVVRVSDRGNLTEEQLLDFVRLEIPANAAVEIAAGGGRPTRPRKAKAAPSDAGEEKDGP